MRQRQLEREREARTMEEELEVDGSATAAPAPVNLVVNVDTVVEVGRDGGSGSGPDGRDGREYSYEEMRMRDEGLGGDVDVRAQGDREGFVDDLIEFVGEGDGYEYVG